MKKEKGGGQGLEAKTSHDTASVSTGRKSSKASVKSSGRSVHSKSKTVRTSKPGFFQSTATMYKCDATAKSARTMNTTTGLSLSGKSFDQNGNHVGNDATAVSMPVICTTVDKAIGGALAFSQLDAWTDNGLNHRGSCDVMVCNGASVEGQTLQCRTSTQDPSVIVLSFALSTRFTNVDRKLEYLLERIAEVHPDTKGDKFACMRILQSHSRYVSCKANLKALCGRSNNQYLVEHRMTAPFPIADVLVTKQEDPIFYGFNINEDEETGETHIHFELKEKGKVFTPVTIDGSTMSSPFATINRSNKKSMFGGFNMGSIPENITFASPNGKTTYRNMEDDDNSTIASNTMADNNRSSSSRAAAAAVGDDDSDDSSWDSNLGEDDAMSTDELETEVEKLRREIEEMRSIISGSRYHAQSRSEDSNDESNGGKISSGSKKKSKTNTGSAGSVTSKSSRHTTATRGTTNREEKRKTPTKKNDNSKDKSE